MRYFCKALSFPAYSDLLHLFTFQILQHTVVSKTFILKAIPRSPAAVDMVASLMLVWKAHDHFWRTERNTVAARNTFSSFLSSQRYKIILAGKMWAVCPRPDDSRCILWPIVVSGRIAGVQAELLSFHRDTSRMALFTSKRFAKTRACHDNFPHLKGNIRSISGSSRNIMSKCQIFLPSTFIFLHERALGEISGRWDVHSENCFQLQLVWWRKRHTPPLIQNFVAEIWGTFYISLALVTSRPQHRHVEQACEMRAFQWRAGVEIKDI